MFIWSQKILDTFKFGSKLDFPRGSLITITGQSQLIFQYSYFLIIKYVFEISLKV